MTDRDDGAVASENEGSLNPWARVALLGGSAVRAAYGVGALLAPAAMVRRGLAPATNGGDDPRLLLRGFGGHQLVVAGATAAAMRDLRLARHAAALSLAIDAFDVGSALLEVRARGAADRTLIDGIAFSGLGVATFGLALAAIRAESTRPGPEYVDGRYVAERRHNPLVQTPLGGRVLSASQLPLFKLRTPKGYAVLTTTGRKTGKKRSRCVRAIRRGDRVFLVAIGGERAGWINNVRANPEVRLRLPDGTHAGTARDLRDAAEGDEAMAAYCDTVNPFDYGACRVHRVGRPTREKIQEMHRTWFEGGLPLVVELGT